MNQFQDLSQMSVLSLQSRVTDSNSAEVHSVPTQPDHRMCLNKTLSLQLIVPRNKSFSVMFKLLFDRSYC